MDIFFTDPDEIPLPPEEVRILNFTADPYPDGKRVRLFLELTPFQKKPSGDIIVIDPSDHQVASTSFVEAVTSKFEMTVHLRAEKAGEFTAAATLYYTEEVEENVEADQVVVRLEKQIVDEAEVRFKLPDS
jgi:hypothetical protein